MDKDEEFPCYSPAHSESELVRLPWHQFGAFAKHMCSVEALFLGFEGPSLRFAKDASHCLAQSDTPRQMYPPCKVILEVVQRMENFATQYRAASISGGVTPQLSHEAASVAPASAGKSEATKPSGKKTTRNGTPKKLPKVKVVASKPARLAAK